MRLTEIKWRWLFQRSYVRGVGNARIIIHEGVNIKNSHIITYPGTRLLIDKDAQLRNTKICLMHGSLTIGRNSIICGTKYQPMIIDINNGDMHIGHHNRLTCRKVWVRFGGKLTIGDHTNINSGSEIRCDERVDIGSYNQISYNVRIWDTNTHTILPAEERRKITVEKFPCFGYEDKRPKTAPVIIGNDCWIGEYSAILKGSKIDDRCIVGFGTIITGKTVPEDTTAINSNSLRLIPND